MSGAVGADIESICSTCGDVWHVVVAKVGEKIARVQCKQCGKLHRHKPPGAETEASAGAGARPAAARASRAATSRGKAKTSTPAGPTVQPDMSRPPRTYQPAETYAKGERIQHASFGTGIVESSPGQGKIQVYFPEGRKVLAMARATSSLAPPPVRPAAEDGEGP